MNFLITDNLISEKERSKFANKLGREIYLLMSSKGRGGEQKWQTYAR